MPPSICALSVFGLTARPGSTAQIDALDREPVGDALQLHHLRDVGFEAAAAADVAIVGDAAERVGRRARPPLRSLRRGVEHAQRQRIVGQEIAPVGVLVDLRAMGELGDQALPEEHRRRRADRAHEIDRDRQRRVDRLHQEVRQPIALIVEAVDHALVPVAFGRVIEPALARRVEQRLAGDARVDRKRIAGLVEHRAQAGAGVRPVDVVLRVLFARADELDRASRPPWRRGRPAPRSRARSCGRSCRPGT